MHNNVSEVDRKDYYRPASSPLELRAYEAAHRIFTSDFGVQNYSCPGTRRSRTVDAIAQMIVEACRPGGGDAEPELQGVHLDRRAS